MRHPRSDAKILKRHLSADSYSLVIISYLFLLSTTFTLLVGPLCVSSFTVGPRPLPPSSLFLSSWSTSSWPTMKEIDSEQSIEVAFHHVQMFVDRLEDLSVYKTLEDQLHRFQLESTTLGGEKDLSSRQALWQSMAEPHLSPRVAVDENTAEDIVQQMLVGFGFRILASRYDDDDPSKEEEEGQELLSAATCSVLVSSRDPRGVQFVITALKTPGSDQNTGSASSAAAFAGQDSSSPVPLPWQADHVQRFLQAHGGRPGIGVLGFVVRSTGALARLRDRYQTRHPRLISKYQSVLDAETGRTVEILEVFAYYRTHGDRSEPDVGTVLRFVEWTEGRSKEEEEPWRLLPGLNQVAATFDPSSQPAYCDHWVSNVWSRTDFLDILHDTLGFTPQVDFNAGVIAAGEAQIESTVAGNQSPRIMTARHEALCDQSQVYLPINNALSTVGHVHGFLQELGQGIQHIASRVERLVDFVQRCNDDHSITRRGITFLRIPRSYYGVLTLDRLMMLMPVEEEETSRTPEAGPGMNHAGLSRDCAQAIMNALEASGLMAHDGAVGLDVTSSDIDQALELDLKIPALLDEYRNNQEVVCHRILQSRYQNLHSLLGTHLSESTYLGIVRNQVLVDIQGEDLLYQIFTANILQRKPRDEAPFLEFIQRVCSERLDEHGAPVKIRPGCGGFGIRNFLTLFLSIEVSKAMEEVSKARAGGSPEELAVAEAKVECFTDQLNESNPILTEIAEAMAEEGRIKDKLAFAKRAGDLDQVQQLEAQLLLASERKRLGNAKLMECSGRYNNRMKAIRLSKGVLAVT